MIKNLTLYLYKHINIVFAAFIVAGLVGLFSSLLEEIYEKDFSVINFDRTFLNYIVSIRTDFLNSFFLLVTKLGNTLPFFAVLSVVLVCFFIAKKYKSIIIIATTVTGSAIITTVIKTLIQRPRPTLGLITESGFSFPSGHAFIAVGFYFVLFFLLSTFTSNKIAKVALILTGAFVALALGFSRIYIGVHWSSDVIASFLLASAYSAIVIYMVENKDKLVDKGKSFLAYIK